MTAPSEQEWKDAIGDGINAALVHRLRTPFPANPRVLDGVIAAIAPLIERERQQARQETLTELQTAISAADDRFANSPGVYQAITLVDETARLIEERIERARRAAGGVS